MNAGIDHDAAAEAEAEDQTDASATESQTDAPETESQTDAPEELTAGSDWAAARQLLYNMVSTPSVSGDEEAAAEVLKVFFEAHDREVWIDEVGNVRAPADDSVLLTSHIDTVPGDIPVKVEDGTLWGRGSVDATGPLCSMAAAAVETGVSFVGVVGEETSSRGAWHLIEDREEPDAVINGEPSGWDGVTLGYRGFLSGTYVATSELGHSSRPEDNAIQSAVAWWSRVADFFDEDRDGVFDTVTTKPVSFDGGPTEDGLAVEATVDVQFRVPPRYTIEDVREVAEGELTRGSVHWNKPIPPVMESPRTEVARAFRVAIRNVGETKPRLLRKTGTSDMNIFAGVWDCPMATYGPGDSDLDHAPDEHLKLDEFDSAIDVLVDVCERLGDD
ncbi:[LysW]-lysine hydrolase [Haloferax mediterranei ATCC 33500]|uniref:Putative [LysW]-lysine/[LysW]-ornithine hydrolase n=1 Tax=Haloferax mediterranei (strain ATCC 33500 / DSM 1411 / JCM 8866 / NBRC 14739 / NCIMB 2177 / R-4) TaxID=523841 RepID=I3R0M6_HALMT|nr:[LysW]-lysine hydrolase [Haloferax mediterranei]AFK17786.1 acetyl-lysine deacetylase [Haloferax mediterranei ATCC 33500]AHZ22784.1 acetyl-lysine deacetylase [Haloferax mediterranei ATCC 33500]EMA02943.1 acetyl-lysine deacetylase [Haloferax mediterranei ATCC 33500]MDX5987875.1 [LysW]-lysine hydrolase [Haloferax mediterranei ATCC 33500]QCQ74349.1 [LysW]-lysine hydrolase [Haloferax mediterranei ATCC 33500]